MLAAVIDIDRAAGVACLQRGDAAIVLFDFTAALPLVSRRCVMAAARAAGLPDGAMEVLPSLCHVPVGVLMLHGRLRERVLV